MQCFEGPAWNRSVICTHPSRSSRMRRGRFIGLVGFVLIESTRTKRDIIRHFTSIAILFWIVKSILSPHMATFWFWLCCRCVVGCLASLSIGRTYLLRYLQSHHPSSHSHGRRLSRRVCGRNSRGEPTGVILLIFLTSRRYEKIEKNNVGVRRARGGEASKIQKNL
jgi:hypothetical protein